MVQKRLATLLLSLGAISPFMAQADQPQPCSPCKKSCDTPCPPKSCEPVKCEGPCDAQKQALRDCERKKCCPFFEMGEPIDQDDLKKDNALYALDTGCYIPAAYNFPAAYKLDDQCWDLFITASYIYWEAFQDTMPTAFQLDNTLPVPTTGGIERELLRANNQYKSGFKVGLGWTAPSFDNWQFYAEYTWYHPSGSNDDGDDDDCGCTVNNFVVYPNCSSCTDLYATDLSSKWKVDVDLADISVQRPFYLGKRLVINPFFGLRGAWIKERFNINYGGALTAAGAAVATTYNTSTHSKSWGVGPRVGMEGSWLLWGGLRIIGNASGSILYTSYTKINMTSNVPIGSGSGAPALATNNTWKYHKKYDALRANAELDTGLGWGMYLGCDNDFHIDLAATYDFNVFWNQNMVEDLQNQSLHHVAAAPGNLYLHGLTIKARFDF